MAPLPFVVLFLREVSSLDHAVEQQSHVFAGNGAPLQGGLNAIPYKYVELRGAAQFLHTLQSLLQHGGLSYQHKLLIASSHPPSMTTHMMTDDQELSSMAQSNTTAPKNVQPYPQRCFNQHSLLVRYLRIMLVFHPSSDDLNLTHIVTSELG